MNEIKDTYSRTEVEDIVKSISERDNKIIMIEMGIIIVLGCIALVSLLM